jgi:transcription-repair coupling factor (superfamily II helicase)
LLYRSSNFERYHKFNIKMAILKAKYYFKRTNDFISRGLCILILDALADYKKFKSKTQEAIKLVYADNDIVYVSIHSLHKFQNTTVKTVRHLKFIS